MKNPTKISKFIVETKQKSKFKIQTNKKNQNFELKQNFCD